MEVITLQLVHRHVSIEESLGRGVLLCVSPHAIRDQRPHGGGRVGVFPPQTSKHHRSGLLSPENQLLRIASPPLDKLLITRSLGNLMGHCIPAILLNAH